MPRFHSTNGKVQGGQLDAAVATASEAAKLLGTQGGEIRFFLTLAAGEDVNGTLFSQEYESPEALGAAFDALGDDAELQALLARLSAPGSPTVHHVAVHGHRDAPRANPESRSRQHPRSPHQPHQPWTSPRMRSLKRRRSAPSSRTTSAVNARCIQLTYAGMASGMVALIWEHENMAAQARAGCRMVHRRWRRTADAQHGRSPRDDPGRQRSLQRGPAVGHTLGRRRSYHLSTPLSGLGSENSGQNIEESLAGRTGSY